MKDSAARAQLRKASSEGSEIFNVERLLGDYDKVYQRALAARQVGRLEAWIGCNGAP